MAFACASVRLRVLPVRSRRPLVRHVHALTVLSCSPALDYFPYVLRHTSEVRLPTMVHQPLPKGILLLGEPMAVR